MPTEQIEPIWVPCDSVKPGMFPDERSVSVRDGKSGEVLSMFVDIRTLAEHERGTFLRVTQLSLDEGTGMSVCVLPVEATESPTGTRWLNIARDRALQERDFDAAERQAGGTPGVRANERDVERAL